MNGNIVKVDNLKVSKGIRRGFIMTQNEILYRLYIQERNAEAYSLYCFIWQRGGSDFNLTVDNISSITGRSKNAVRKSLKTLQEVGLLEVKQEKDIPGMPKVITTQDGRQVPNTRRKYVIYSALQQQGVEAQRLTPGTVVTPVEFTTDEMLESEETPEQATSVIAEPPKARQETPPPVLKPPQSREPVLRDSKISAGLERRKEQVYRIAADNGLFSKTGKDKLLYWLQRFAKEVGRPAADDEVAYMANVLSGDSGYNLSGYIKRRALSELPV